jgi:hypothetical protein
MKHVIGFAVGVILFVTPEPVTTALGLGIMSFIAYKNGWLGKP